MSMHSFAPFWNPQSKIAEKRTWPKQHRKGENERPLSSSTLLSTSAKGGCIEKIARIKIEKADDIWSPFSNLKMFVKSFVEFAVTPTPAKFRENLVEKRLVWAEL